MLTFNTFYGTIMLVKRGLGMNVFSIVRNLFKKKETGITKIGDNVNIRSRSDLSDFDVQKLDVFKKEYLDKLRNRILFSGDLDENEFKTTMDMYIELVLNLFLKEFSEFESIEEYSEQLYLVLKSKKLGLYLHDILGVINEIELRIIALEEILNEMKSFNVSKRRAINNKLENMLLLFHTFQVQREAIFMDAVSNIKLASTQNEILDEKMVLEKRDRLFKMFSIMLPNRIPYFRSENFESVLDEIAYLERELEIGVFKHKDVIKYIEDMIDTYSINNVTLKDIQELELRIRVFSDYGRDLVSDELLDKLYKKKFGVVTKDIIKSYDENYFKNLSFIEIDKYKEIIFSKINDIAMGNNQILTKAFGKDYGYYVRIIVDILKDGDVQFDFYKILTSKFLLSFLVSLDSEESIVDFFRLTKQDCSLYEGLYFGEDIFKWDNDLSLQTLSILMDFSLEKFDILSLGKKLLSSFYKEKTSSCYSLPEGISEINCNLNKSNPLLDHIRENSKDKAVYMPSTLKYINGDIFGGVQFKVLVLNEGIIGLLNFPAYKYDNLDVLHIPSSLKVIGDTSDDISRKLSSEEILNGSLYYSSSSNYITVSCLIFNNCDLDELSPNIINVLLSFFSVKNASDLIGKNNFSSDVLHSYKKMIKVDTSLYRIIFVGKYENLEFDKYDLDKFVVMRKMNLSCALRKEELYKLLEHLFNSKNKQFKLRKRL